MSAVSEIIDNAKMPETTQDICLRSDLVSEWEQLSLQRDLEEQEQESRKLGGKPSESETTARMRELEEQMRAATITVRLRALQRGPWMQLVQAHPPREGNDGDRRLGVNGSTFLDAMIEQ